MDKKTLLGLSYLAKIELTTKELEKLAKDIAKILKWIKILNRVNTAGIIPTTGIFHKKYPRKLRKDKSKKKNREEILSNAKTEYNYFIAPKIIEDMTTNLPEEEETLE